MHVETHCCGVGEPRDPPTIPVTIHNCEFLNLAVALWRWPDETDAHFKKRDKELQHLIEKMGKLATPPGVHAEMYTFEPSYVHPEP